MRIALPEALGTLSGEPAKELGEAQVPQGGGPWPWDGQKPLPALGSDPSLAATLVWSPRESDTVIYGRPGFSENNKS